MLEKTLLASLFFAAAAAVAPAQDTAQKPARFVLEPGVIEIGALIDRAAAHLGWNILVDQRELANGNDKLTLQNRIDVDHDGCADMLTTMLATRNVAVRMLDEEKSLYEVIALNGPRAREYFSSPAQRTPEAILLRPNLRMPVSTVVSLQHINSMVAVNGLRPFFASAGGANSITLGSAGATGSLMIIGMQDQVANAIRMLQKSDVPPAKGAEEPGLAEQVAALNKRVAKLENAIASLLEKLKEK